MKFLKELCKEFNHGGLSVVFPAMVFEVVYVDDLVVVAMENQRHRFALLFYCLSFETAGELLTHAFISTHLRIDPYRHQRPIRSPSRSDPDLIQTALQWVL